MNKQKVVRAIASIISIVLIISMVLATVITVFADESRVLTLGADLTPEQKELILNYLNVDTNSVSVVEVNNSDERQYLEGVIPDQKIGHRTLSCAYIEPTDNGGIHIKTVNLNWVTCDMLRNALVTSGITNCNIIAVAPIEVSGTGSLAGIFKAYESVSGQELSESKKELATNELITTAEMSYDIGSEEASSLISELKQAVIESGLSDENSIKDEVEKYLNENKINLTDDQVWQLVDLLLAISKQDYNIEEIKQSYKDIKQTASDIMEAANETKNFFSKIIQAISDAWHKITGTYEEIKQTEEYQVVSEQLGILLETNDSLLDNNTVVTITEEPEVLDNVDEQQNNDELPWYKKLFNKNKSQEAPENTEELNTYINKNIDFSTIKEMNSDSDVNDTITDENNNNLSENTENTNSLDSVTFEMQDYTKDDIGKTLEENDGLQNNGKVPSLNELAN